ncbi:DNA helicase [Paramuricea clavata]|uniref:DNA 3'-5' helicase n=1 Tax=Paramuricea clavata TaxID=317549 RepID=A0A7D9HWS9_PARCT|nr:DNA helicase [Paramuricea clavata]
MAEETMAGIALNFNSEMRPFDDAFTDRKLPCPHRSCRSETEKAFFQDLAQHYRIKHRELAFNKEKHTQEARRLFNLFHGNETKQDKYIRYTVTTKYEACLVFEVIAKDTKEAAKLAGVVLMHFGQLKSYGEGTKPSIVENLSLDLTGDNIMPINQRDINIDDMTGKKSVDILRSVFHYDVFRGKQEEAIDSICQGQNTLLIMPTGCGKSLCYAVPALMEQKLVVVVFPLLALLFDQFERMKSKGLNVGFLMKDMDEMDRQSVIHKLHSNPPEYNLLFLTPETVLSPSVFDLLSKLSSENLINFFVIDKAHCIDTWGFHFRPCYAELWRLGTLECPIMAQQKFTFEYLKSQAHYRKCLLANFSHRNLLNCFLNYILPYMFIQ